jgi:hypothetical protein
MPAWYFWLSFRPRARQYGSEFSDRVRRMKATLAARVTFGVPAAIPLTIAPLPTEARGVILGCKGRLDYMFPLAAPSQHRGGCRELAFAGAVDACLLEGPDSKTRCRSTNRRRWQTRSK